MSVRPNGGKEQRHANRKFWRNAIFGIINKFCRSVAVFGAIGQK
jgi:hypothetical protein